MKGKTRSAEKPGINRSDPQLEKKLGQTFVDEWLTKAMDLKDAKAPLRKLPQGRSSRRRHAEHAEGQIQHAQAALETNALFRCSTLRCDPDVSNPAG